MDISLIVALLATITAIIAPCVVAYFNNRHTLRIKELERFEILYKDKLELYQNFSNIFFDWYCAIDKDCKILPLYSVINNILIVGNSEICENVFKLLDMIKRYMDLYQPYNKKGVKDVFFDNIESLFRNCVLLLNKDLMDNNKYYSKNKNNHCKNLTKSNDK